MTKKINLRIEDEAAIRLSHAAARSKRSLNAQIEWYIDRGLDADEFQERAASSEIHHKDGDRTSLELDNLELRDTPKENQR